MLRLDYAQVPVAGVAFASALVLAACTPQEEEQPEIGIQVAPAEYRDLRVTAEATGELEPVLRVEVKSKASGEILDLFVDSGDEVEPGTILARVDPRDVQNSHDQAVADLDVAEARIGIARAQLTRSEELLESEVITAQEYEQTQLEYANAQAALVRAQTNLELATLRLNDVTIRAPMAGVILEKLVEYGQVIQSATQNVSGGNALFTMANLDNMRVRTLVDETDVGQLMAGMVATVQVEAFPDRTFQGEIEKIEPQAVVEQNVTMFPVIVLLNNQAGLLKPGMNAEVEVLVNERTGALTVPNNAVVQPQELAPAAEVLGLDPQSVSIDRSAWGDLMAQAAARSGGAAPGAMAARPGGGAPGGTGMPGSDMARIRAGMESGEISADSARALFAAMRDRRAGGQEQGGDAGQEGGARAEGQRDAGAGPGRPESVDGRQAPNGEDAAAGQRPDGGRAFPGGQGGGRAGGGRGFGGLMAAMGGSSGDPAFRPAVAFVVDAAGNIEPRPVVMGVSDWDYAEILAGLEEGEQLALIGAAQLQARQQERINQMRGRFRPF